MLVVRCPRCKHEMRYQPRGRVVGKVKRCVFCGYSFSIHRSPQDSRIVRVENGR